MTDRTSTADSDAIDAAVGALRAGSRIWTALTLRQRARLFERTSATVGAAAGDWAATASRMKGLDERHPLRGEEWLTGPYPVLAALAACARSLDALAQGRSPADDLATGSAPGTRETLRVFPGSTLDATLLSGFTADVWLRPGVRAADAVARAGLAQRDPGAGGGIGLVLGAGNVTSIPLLDALFELIGANRVALVKLNPTMDSLLPVFTRAFAPLIEIGLVRFMTGGGEVGASLIAHPGIDHVHITGSAETFDAIVWGPPAGREEKRAANDPVLRQPITAELGGVSPVIVVPGPWSAADLRFQAEHIATMRLHNSGHNCIAGQVVLVSRDWAQYDDFIAALRAAFARAPQRPVWYPRAAERVQEAADLPGAERHGDRVLCVIDDRTTSGEAGAAGAAPHETAEHFAPILAVVALDGLGQEFLDAAVAHADSRLRGNLGANVLIDPATLAELGQGFEEAIARLRFGVIGVNAWTGFAFTTPGAPWGAYPGGTLADVGSGIGAVHNAFLLDDVERTVLRGPFRPFPRSIADGVRRPGTGTVLPTPPWFVTARTGARVSEGFTRQLIDGDPRRLAGTLLAALRA